MGLEPVIQGVDPSGPVNGGANDNHVVPFPSPNFPQKKRKKKKERKWRSKSKQTKKQEDEEQYCKIPKTSLQRPFLRGLSTEGNLHFKIDWASLVFGSNKSFPIAVTFITCECIAIKHLTDYIWLYFQNLMKENGPRKKVTTDCGPVMLSLSCVCFKIK